MALSPLTQAFPGRVIRFGSTGSSPPVSPSPSERSLAGLSPDETSCNGDMFGEMVSTESQKKKLVPQAFPPNILRFVLFFFFFSSGELSSDSTHLASLTPAAIHHLSSFPNAQ